MRLTILIHSKFNEYHYSRSPRIRGEHTYFGEGHIIEWGSPPHTRGTHCSTLFLPFRAGITPAYAGNTFFRITSISFPWDHPRIRGEHLDSVCDSVFGLGSPPHTRGTLSESLPSAQLTGITPAYAGNTKGR